MFYLHPTFLYDWIISYCSVKRSWLCFYNILDAQSQMVFSTKRLFKNFTRKELLLFLLRAPFLCVVSNDPNSLSSRFFLTYIWSTGTSVLASKKREETMVLRRSSTLKDYLLRVETFFPLPLWVVVCMCFRSCFQWFHLWCKAHPKCMTGKFVWVKQIIGKIDFFSYCSGERSRNDMFEF